MLNVGELAPGLFFFSWLGSFISLSIVHGGGESFALRRENTLKKMKSLLIRRITKDRKENSRNFKILKFFFYSFGVFFLDPLTSLEGQERKLVLLIY